MPRPVLAQRRAEHDTGNPDRTGAAGSNPGEWGALWVAAMRAGAFPEAWAVSDQVLAAHDPATRDDPRQPYHLRWVWDGRDPTGQDVLVRCYHGLGDTLQFCRYLAPLRQRAARVTLEVQPELVPLLRDLAGPDLIVPFRTDAPLPPSACDLEIMELPHALRLQPSPAPYLSAAPLAQPASGLLVGVCWQAGAWDPGRSMPLHCLASLARVPGVRLVNLQRGPAADDAAQPGAPPLLLAGDRSTDIVATARLIASLDVMVAVDTMVAHLAGALGKPTHVLLQADADWRWMAGRADSPWYSSLCLHRQSSPGDWSAPVAEIAAALALRTSGMAGEPYAHLRV